MNAYFKSLFRQKVNLAISLLILVGSIFLVITDAAPVKLIRLGYFDQLQIIKPRVRLSPEKSPVVVVNIDEESMATHGQWPWDRRLLAKVVKNLDAAGTAAIVFDVIFAERDRTGGDPEFANSIKGRNVVVGMGNYYRHTSIPNRPRLEKSVAIRRTSTNTLDINKYVVRAIHMVRNIPAIEDVAFGHGFFGGNIGIDGKIRTLSTLTVYDQFLYPSLGMEALRAALNRSWLLVETNQAGITHMKIGQKLTIPVDRYGRTWPHFAEYEPDLYVSINDVISGAFNPDQFAGKIVVIGTDAVGLGHFEMTPLNRQMPSVEFQAQQIEAILTGQLLVRPNYAGAIGILSVFFVGFLMVFVMPGLTLKSGLIFTVVLTALTVSLSWYSFANHRFLIDASFPVVIIILLFVVNIVIRSIRQEKQIVENMSS